MKRKSDLYIDICNLDNIELIFSKVFKSCKNKNKLYRWESVKDVLIVRIYLDLINRDYHFGKYHKFIIYEPKKRVIMAMNMYDKIINHLVSDYILLPSIIPGLIDSNVASRKGKGTSYGVYLYYKYRNICNSKYGKDNYYLLKLDIHKFFDSINHNILKVKLRNKIKDEDAINILDTIIDSIDGDNGIPIGANTSQLFAIFYLDDVDKYIKNTLKIKYYIRYQDDMILIHSDKDYLKYCLNEIRNKLDSLNMKLNQKTKIYKSNENINFIGVRKNRKYSNISRTRKKYKRMLYKYKDGKVSLNSLISSKKNYINRRRGVKIK